MSLMSQAFQVDDAAPPEAETSLRLGAKTDCEAYDWIMTTTFFNIEERDKKRQTLRCTEDGPLEVSWRQARF